MPGSNSRPTIWFVGLTTLDVVHRGVAPASRNQKVTASWQGVSAGGPAANAAVVAARLGARVVLLTALGAEPVAALAAADLAAQGVEVWDFADPDFQFPISAVLVDSASGERSVVSLDGGLWRGPSLEQFSRLVADFFGTTMATLAAGDGTTTARFASDPESPPLGLGAVPNLVLFDGHHSALARQVAKTLLSLPESKRPLVLLDGGRWRPIFEQLLPLADIAAVSSDFRIGSTTAIVEPEELLRAARAQFGGGTRGAGPQAVVITAGPNPVRWARAAGGGTESGAVPVPQVAARDTLGAGDAWHGALAYYLALGVQLPEAIAQANRVAAVRVTHLGNREWLGYLVCNRREYYR